VNVQEYILSGIVESYVLGLSGTEERAEFERMCAAHAEVRAARDAFERTLEKQLLSNAVAPPSNLKSKIIADIEIENEKTQGKKVVSLKQSPIVQAGWLRYVAAAAVILLVGSTILNFYFFTQYKQYISKYNELLAAETQMASANQKLQTKLQEYDAMMSIMKDTAMAIVKMPANPDGPMPGIQTTVYWNTTSKDVYLLVNNLPTPTPGKQYQLWAIVDGKPVDAGIFDMQAGPMKMKNIPSAQAFAITLEPKGGSATPTMPIYVMGKTSS